MTKPIYLNHGAAEAATTKVTVLVAAMMGNTERLEGLKKGLAAVLQGAMGDNYHLTMNSFNTDLGAYDAQVQKLNKAVQAAAASLQHTDIRAGNMFAGLGRS
ncbi:hypothetical protein AB0E01_40230 [Nocardia vinacea]|uniref:hypothetical protein n=1 Tax=Nocardia vinacea TaxID=96468 RepID=UPI0033F5CFFC